MNSALRLGCLCKLNGYLQKLNVAYGTLNHYYVNYGFGGLCSSYYFSLQVDRKTTAELNIFFSLLF